MNISVKVIKMNDTLGKLNKHIDLLLERYPQLSAVKSDIIAAYKILENCYQNGGKLLIAGNGGSARPDAV